MFHFSQKFLREKNKFAVLRCQCQDIQMVFKMCRINNQNDVAQKLKEMTDSHRNKIALEKKHLNKQMIQSMQGLRNI